MKVRKTQKRDEDGLVGQVCVVVDLAPLQAGHPRVHSVMWLDSLRHTNLDETIQWCIEQARIRGR
jgi:hypothetical protein